MQVTGDVEVFYILIPAFLAVGVYLFLYGRRRGAMLRRFARQKGLRHLSRDINEKLGKELDAKLRIDETGKGRAFSLIRDIVTDGGVAVFRCIEALDLNPYHMPYNTHGHRICITFSTSGNPPDRYIDIVLRARTGRYASLLTKGRVLSQGTCFQKVRDLIEIDPPKHAMSITISRGRVLIYLIPVVHGSEKMEDVEYLFKLGGRLKHALDTKPRANNAVY